MKRLTWRVKDANRDWTEVIAEQLSPNTWTLTLRSAEVVANTCHITDTWETDDERIPRLSEIASYLRMSIEERLRMCHYLDGAGLLPAEEAVK